MMFTELNASGYNHNDVFYNAEFEDILSKIIACYRLMLINHEVLTNDENQIRDVLYLNYLNHDPIRKIVDLKYYYFDRETKEDKTIGRTDIRVLTANSFFETAAYYIIECKRLDASNPNGKTGLNSKYITNGICRFTSNLYSTHYKTNGLIGFLVQYVNITQNTTSINQLLSTTFKQDAYTEKVLEYRKIVDDFDSSYYSTHNVNGTHIALYHLMFDFSTLILPN